MTDQNWGAAGERFVAEVCKDTVFADYVFANPKYLRGKVEKELCDVLIFFEDTMLLIQIKTADHVAHRRFHQEKRHKWKTRKVVEATKQLAGAYRAIANKMITNVTNERQGVVKLPDPAHLQIFGLVVVDYLKEEPLRPGVVRLPHVEGMKCLLFNFDDMVLLTHELSTVGDLFDYIKIRAEIRSVVFEGSDELDLLAMYKTRRDLFDLREPGTALPDLLVVQEGIWNEYSSFAIREARDEADRPSWIFDAIVDKLFDGRQMPDAFTAKVPTEPTEESPRDERYILFVNELNRYRRTERRVLGYKLIEKSNACSPQRPDRYFLAIYPERCPILFMVSQSPRPKRIKKLQHLTFAAKLKEELPKIIGIATEPSNVDNRSVDVCYLDSDPLHDREDFTPEMLVELDNLFSGPTRQEVDEFPKSISC